MGLLDLFRSTTPSPEPDRKPRGASGRGHTGGFLDLEEYNHELRHPQGHTIYDKMYRTDGDVRQVVQLVSNPILAGTWQMLPYGGESAVDADIYIAEAVKWALWDVMSPNLAGHLQQMLPVLVRSGMAPFECAWMRAHYEPTDGKAMDMVVPRTLAVRLPRTIEQFEQDSFGNLTRIKQRLPVPMSTLTAVEGQNNTNSYGDESGYVWIPASDLVYYRIGAEGDNWEGVSLLRPAYKHWLMKDKIERIDAIAQEREALGVPICYPPLGASDTQLDDIEDVLRNMRTNEQSYIVAPGPKSGAGAPEGQGWLFEVIGYDRTGSGRDPQPSLNYHTNKIAAAFISEFMRLGHGQTGARATAQVQADPFLMSVEALTSLVENALNEQLVRPLVAHNFPDAKNPPRLKMSLVDSTSLTQLADYVLKLTQIGAMLPDQELEDFLRARADLPPANPASVRKRKTQDDKIRRDIVTGGMNGDPYGQNQNPATEHGNKSPAQKDSRGVAGGAPGQGGGMGGSAPKSRDEDGNIILDGMGHGYHRPLRHDEANVALDEIDSRMDMMPHIMEANCYGPMHTLARDPHGDPMPLRDAIHGHLCDAYDFGAGTVDDEVGNQDPDTKALDRGARDRGRAHLGQRADIAASHVIHALHQAKAGNDLTHGNEGRAQAAAEKAGRRALRDIGFDHGVSAIVHGREDRAKELAQAGVPIAKARYTSILDRSRCDNCAEADDGTWRELDDPFWSEYDPPNPHCDSTASGHNRCRCFKTYMVDPGDGTTLDASLVPNDPTKTNWVEKAGGLPGYIGDIAGDLISERGMDTSRAIAVAVQRVRVWAQGGGRVSPSTQMKAIDALAEWERMKASA